MRILSGLAIVSLGLSVSFASWARDVSRLVAVDLPELSLDSEGFSPMVSFTIPEGAVSFLITVTGGKSSRFIVTDLISPSGKVLVSDHPPGVVISDQEREQNEFAGFDKSPNRSTISITPGSANLLVPNNPAVTAEAGLWKTRIFGWPEKKARIRIVTKVAEQLTKKGRLDLHFFVSGAHQWKANNTADNAVFLETIGTLKAQYAQVGIQINVASIDALPASFAFPKFVELPAIGAYGKYADGVQVYVIKNVVELQGEGYSMSLGLPGSAGTAGTSQSGILLFAESQGPNTSPGSLSLFLSHEIGHYLGLYHSTDRDLGEDQIPDTQSHDEWNLMYWSPASQHSVLRLTPGQGQVLLNSPAVVLVDE